MKVLPIFLVTALFVGTTASAVAPTGFKSPDRAQAMPDAGIGQVAQTDPALPADSVAAPAAHLQLDSTYLDLGNIVRDSIGEGVMRFRNTGDAPLVIHRVFTDCGCTVPSYSSKPVAPGDTGEIHVRFKTKGRSLGFFRKSLRVKSNADNPREVFSVKGHVIALNPKP